MNQFERLVEYCTVKAVAVASRIHRARAGLEPGVNERSLHTFKISGLTGWAKG